MIGLTYIREIKNMTMETLADTLGTTKQNISLWENSPTRKIPTKYLPQLSTVFRLPEHYFQMELTEEDKLDIQICRARQGFSDSIVEYEDEVYDHKSGAFISVSKTHYDAGAAEYLEWLEAQKRAATLYEKVKSSVHNVEKYGYDSGDPNRNPYDHDKYVADNITLIDRMIDIADRADIAPHFLRHVLKAIELLNRECSELEDEHKTTKQVYVVLNKCYQEEKTHADEVIGEHNQMLKLIDELADDDLY